jgi:ATP adenylyltransferase
MDSISERQALTTFDELVAEGVIVYGPHTKHQLTDEGYPVCTATPIFLNKPQLTHL